MTIMLITSDNINYTCLGVFQWETMPISRYKDAFGLTRGTNLSIVNNSASGAITEYYSEINTSLSGTTTIPHQNDVSYNYQDLEHSSDGHAMEFNIPVSYVIPSSSTQSLSIIYNEMLGCISYNGMIGLDNIVSANHFSVYAHKIKTVSLQYIDFSVSFPTSFTIGGFAITDTYIQRSTNHTWIR
ncbi:MAG: hypothetical protein IJW86_00615 [Clostridia bacterium]|nr:hypothetical protein [Clostridia bacterium]